MAQLMQNPSWIGVIIGAGSLLIALISFALSYRFAWRRKRLSCETFPLVSLVSVAGTIGGKEVKVLFEDQTVTDLSTLSANIRNSGNDAIEKQDYWDPVTIDLGEGVRVLSAEVSSTEPPGIDASVAPADSSKVVLNPVPLNGGDVVSLGIVLTGSTDLKAIAVNGRIKGVKRIAKVSGTEESSGPLTLLLIGVVVVVVVVAAVVFFVSSLSLSVVLAILVILPLVLGWVSALLARAFEAIREGRGALSILLEVLRRL